MGVASELFLAGACLAADEDRHLASSSGLDPSHNSCDRGISGHELRGDLLRRRRTRSGNSLNHRKLARVLDGRDKLASHFVFEALAFLAPALIDKDTKFRTKDVGETTAR